ncbi:hypothetical protein [Denitrificimonas caeni]|uniref:hypothetical protein n=1 Tax=Denitrificimonas caeni TaxID=521720 RepID=UPI00196527A4|nr:hypothetical protein [Denitrificimonas caeni]
MHFTFEQYIPLLALLGAVMVFGIFSYHCGVKDRAEKIKEAVHKAERLRACNNDLHAQLTIIEHRADTCARAIELLNDELEAANIIKRRQLEATLQAEDVAEAYSELAVHLKNEIDALKLLALSDTQRKTIRQAASQLLLASQIMAAINNKESAATQSTLASRLQSIISEPAPEKEAA